MNCPKWIKTREDLKQLILKIFDRRIGSLYQDQVDDLLTNLDGFLRPDSLPWTSIPPTQPGWYWIQPRSRRKFPAVIRLFYLMTEKELWAETMGGKKVPVEDYEEAFLWSGPIEPPEDKFDGLMAGPLELPE